MKDVDSFRSKFLSCLEKFSATVQQIFGQTKFLTYGRPSVEPLLLPSANSSLRPVYTSPSSIDTDKWRQQHLYCLFLLPCKRFDISCQRARLLLRRSEFKSRWSLQFYSVKLCKKLKINKKAGDGPFKNIKQSV